MMKRGGYEDKFEDVMQYAEMRLNNQGIKVKVKSKEDLRKIFQNLDRVRRDSKGRARMSPQFIDRIINTSNANNAVGDTIGKFGRTVELKQTPKTTQRVNTARSQGRELYNYPQGQAFKSTYKSKKGNLVVVFKDASTGRFVKKSSVSSQ